MPDDDRFTLERFVTQIDDDMFPLHYATNNGNVVFMEVMSAGRIAIRSRDGNPLHSVSVRKEKGRSGFPKRPIP
jgi:hypothetical protein